jgi:hypothetical protein
VSDDDLGPATTPAPFAPALAPTLDALAPVQTPEVGVGDDDEIEIVGTLQQIGDGFIVVSGQRIGVIGAEIKNPLVVGALVNGQLVAREVENADLDDDDDFDDNDNSGSGGGDDDSSGSGNGNRGRGGD